MTPERVAAGEYLGYERYAAYRLLYSGEAREDLLAQVRVWALEATQKFDESKGPFSSFLHLYLQRRSISWIRERERKQRKCPGPMLPLFERDVTHTPRQTEVEIAELMAGLSPGAQEFLIRALEENSRELRSALTSAYYRAKVSRVMGTPRETVAEAIAELRREIPRYVTGVTA